jgi:hypothetical protein
VEENDSKLLICADPLNTVQISIDHFQFIQLTRLQEMVNELTDKIKHGKKTFPSEFLIFVFLDREFFGQRYSQKMEQVDLLIYALIDRVSFGAQLYNICLF